MCRQLEVQLLTSLCCRRADRAGRLGDPALGTAPAEPGAATQKAARPAGGKTSGRLRTAGPSDQSFYFSEGHRI